MITKTGLELVKVAAIYGPTKRAILAGAEALHNFAAKRARTSDFAAQKPYRQMPMAYRHFMEAAVKELEPYSKQEPHRFLFGDIGGREVYGTVSRLAEIPGKRIAQTSEHAGGKFSDLTLGELDELLTIGMPDDPAKVLKGVSFPDRRFREISEAIKQAHKGLTDAQVSKILKARWGAIKDRGMDAIDANMRLYPDRLYNLRKQYDLAGVNNMYITTPDIVTKSGHRPVVFTRPIDNPNKFGDADEFTTLYRIYPDDLSYQESIGRIVEPLKSMK